MCKLKTVITIYGKFYTYAINVYTINLHKKFKIGKLKISGVRKFALLILFKGCPNITG
ncbi:hypothetical protein GCM10023189_25980 [Nibrella saemangeumensis]|uniref:Uncharacterized protein n=1 Tax=Nibrella saemangeumensis TaxID=1084526 RepID=A0ABP8MUY7_9BACT